MGEVSSPQEEAPRGASERDLISQSHWRFPLKMGRGRACSVHPKASESSFVPRKRIKKGTC